MSAAEIAAMPPFERHEGYSEPLHRAITKWFQQLSPTHIFAFHDFLKYELGTIGTLCSGSDGIMVFFDQLARFAEAQYGKEMVVRQLFACESDDDKRNFIMRFHSPQFVFKDTADMAEPTNQDCKTGRLVMTPGVDIVFDGFQCKSRSPLNNKASALLGCVQDGVGKTGESFSDVLEYVRTKKPKILFLENVVQLMEPSKGQGKGDSKSDADYVTTVLREAGYCGKWFEIQASDYGSFACRKRIYYVGFNTDLWPPEESAFRWGQMDEMLTSMKVPFMFFDPSDFILSDSDLAKWPAAAARGAAVMAERQQKMAKTEKFEKTPVFWELHNDYYKDKSIPWPPEKHPCFEQIANQLSDREYQVLYFISKVFPHIDDSDVIDDSVTSKIGFADLNLSMKFMCPKDSLLPPPTAPPPSSPPSSPLPPSSVFLRGHPVPS